MPEVVLLIGVPGAGKSTFYESRFAATHRLVSKDLLRNDRRPALRQVALLEQALDADESVVIDNTNASREERAVLIGVARARNAHVAAYFFVCSLGECVARNADRLGRARVAPVAIFATAKRLEAPSFAEGFDAVFLVRPLPEKCFEVESV
ncbi:MAG TPA: AAA family ATPase [Polyangiaceae bacterium]|nr:AAA family ATPase [Polyangiaceae bacterium]